MSLELSKRARLWMLFLIGALVIALIATLGGALRGALASSNVVVMPSPSSMPTVYLTDPPAPGPAGDPVDLAPVDPAPPSTVIPTGAVAPNRQPVFGTLAVSLLSRIPVRDAATASGYARGKFGVSWLDLAGTGCDSRNQTLKRDLANVSFANGSASCVVQNGDLRDPYLGGQVVFDRSAASMIQIDQVVSLVNAWQTGAQALTEAQRMAFANDQLNLMAVDAMASVQKKSADAAVWLPPNRGYRCAYVARQISVKATYGLWMTQGEHDAIAAVLTGCPQTKVPTNQLPAADSTVPPVDGADSGIGAGQGHGNAGQSTSGQTGSGQTSIGQGNSGIPSGEPGHRLPAGPPIENPPVENPPVENPPAPNPPADNKRPTSPVHPPFLPPPVPPADDPLPPGFFPEHPLDPLPPLDPPRLGPWGLGPGNWTERPVVPPDPWIPERNCFPFPPAMPVPGEPGMNFGVQPDQQRPDQQRPDQQRPDQQRPDPQQRPELQNEVARTAAPATP